MTDHGPTLIVVTGPSGAGKTVLATRVADEVPCPSISRDELRDGLVHARGPTTSGTDDDLAHRANEAFFAAARLLAEHQVTHVLDAAFQHHRWEPGLRPLRSLARMRIVVCRADPLVAVQRVRARLREQPARRAAHGDEALLEAVEAGRASLDDWEPPRLDVPTLTVDTSDGYDPPLDRVLEFVTP